MVALSLHPHAEASQSPPDVDEVLDEIMGMTASQVDEALRQQDDDAPPGEPAKPMGGPAMVQIISLGASQTTDGDDVELAPVPTETQNPEGNEELD